MTEQNKWRKNVLTLVEVVPTIMTVLFASYVVLRAQLQTQSMSTEQLLVWVLTILAAMATSELVLRLARMGRIESLTLSVYKSVKDISFPLTAERFFKNRKQDPLDLAEKLGHARTVWICAPACGGILRENYLFLCNWIRSGGRIKCLFLCENSEATKMITQATKWDRLVPEIRATRTYLSDLRKQAGKKEDRVEYKTLQTMPTWGMIVIDGDQTSGWLSVELFPSFYETPPEPRPHFELRRGQDGQWYQFFLDEFNLLWEATNDLETNDQVVPIAQAVIKPAQ